MSLEVRAAHESLQQLVNLTRRKKEPIGLPVRLSLWPLLLSTVSPHGERESDLTRYCFSSDDVPLLKGFSQLSCRLIATPFRGYARNLSLRLECADKKCIALSPLFCN